MKSNEIKHLCCSVSLAIHFNSLEGEIVTKFSEYLFRVRMIMASHIEKTESKKIAQLPDDILISRKLRKVHARFKKWIVKNSGHAYIITQDSNCSCACNCKKTSHSTF
jgi:hypothetical protein